MNKKLYWGLGVLAVLLIGVSLGLLIRTTNTETKSIYRDVEPSQEVVDHMRLQTSEGNPPPAEPGFKWVWHHNHWDKVPIAEAPHGQHADETPIHPTESMQTEGKTDLSKYEGKPFREDLDFYRDLFSREELESMLKTQQRTVERYRTEFIPQLEDLRKRYLKLLQGTPDSEHFKKGLADVEVQLNQRKFELNNLEKMIVSKLKVLNEEVNYVEE